MIVGDLRDAVNESKPSGTPPIVVHNLFDALGEVNAASASSPIVTVIVSDRLIEQNGASSIEALRKLDPALRLVLARHNGESRASLDWMNRGFDECVEAPLGAAEWLRFVDEDAANLNPAPSAPPAHPSSSPSPEDNPPTSKEPALKSAEVEQAGVKLDDLKQKLAAVQEVAKQISPGSATHGEFAASHTEPGGASAESNPSSASSNVNAARHLAMPLGDTDLVDAILAQRGNVAALALQLVSQQTRWTDLSFGVGDSLASPGSCAADVTLTTGSERFGVLISRQANTKQLQPWAEWLAHWLALDAAHRDFHLKAHQDDLTGAWNRRYFESFLAQSIAEAGRVRRPVTVMVFDLDNFKAYNDEYGHEAGDEILRETVKLLNSVIRQGDRVCRIGGDEFAVIFADLEARTPGSTHPESVDVIANRFQDQIRRMRFPKLGEQAKGMISISAGLATFPWDGHDPQTLLRKADQLSLESKKGGKNAITLGPGTHRVCGPEA